uniref:NADH dehydrogenase subunit 5 n=1 Tax=Caprella penantis TaxID=1282972 RepID=UPI0023D7CE7C|nr:NADH dehydrogenase subunit 5 [Caprella penantis]WCR50883.1 NADH dehydrogenase subunit 5 [Caprella penantis]
MSSGSLLLLSFLSLYFSLNFSMDGGTLFLEWEIFNYNSVSILMSIILDQKSCFFLSTVFLISSFIMIYSIYYMEGDTNKNRFGFLLVSFITSMLFLIISPNLISLMLGWDGLGLTSYALVIYYQSEYSANSGMITILSNRVGDSTIMLAIGWMFYKASYNFMSPASLDNLILILVIISSFTKSAQLPFSAWLPAAMAAPTPVSALVHSSTLVTAGVFLIVRFSNLITQTNLQPLMLGAGLLTMLAAGWVANFETDLKKVIALSTLSQLGLMFTILGMGNSELAFLHLIMHAFFKSALFMAAGFIIHDTNNSQEGRFVHSFNVSSPFMCMVFSCTNISLCGLPFMTGFFSKDAILEQSFSLMNSLAVFLLIVLSTGLTLAYSLRAAMMVSTLKSFSFSVSAGNDFNTHLMYATHALFMLSIVGGWFLSWLILPFLKIFVMSFTQKFSVIFILATTTMVIFVITKSYFTMGGGVVSYFSYLMIFVPMMTKLPMTRVIKSNSQTLLNTGESGWLEEMGPNGVIKKSKQLSYLVNKSSLLIMVTQFLLAFTLIYLLVLVNCLL